MNWVCPINETFKMCSAGQAPGSVSMGASQCPSKAAYLGCHVIKHHWRPSQFEGCLGVGTCDVAMRSY